MIAHVAHVEIKGQVPGSRPAGVCCVREKQDTASIMHFTVVILHAARHLPDSCSSHWNYSCVESA